MKVAVVGLGAVGGFIAAKLASSGAAVSGLARGATLRAVRERGLRLRTKDGEQVATLAVSDDAAALGVQDLVVIALKGQALPEVAPTLRPLIGPDTLVLPAMNGVPWWFLQSSALDGKLASDDRGLASVDPGGSLLRDLPTDQLLGCVVHLTCSQPEPGVVAHGFGERLIVGEPKGGTSSRADAVARVLGAAGFETEVSADIRRDIWFKLWGNMTANPISALTNATMDRMLDDPLVRAFTLRAMAEAAQIGEAIGCAIAQSGEDRLAVARKLGAFKTSMLQDTEAGRALEIDAIIGAAHEIARKLRIATPDIDALFGLVRLMARSRGLYPPAP